MQEPPRPQTIAGIPILFVIAAEPEYGPALRARITPLITGVGPVEAAVQLTAALAGMPELPELIVSLGSAGSNRLGQAEIYQVGAVAYRDMDASALGFERGRTPFLDLPARIELPHRIPDLPTASLSTGANIVSGSAYAGIDENIFPSTRGPAFRHPADRIARHLGRGCRVARIVGLDRISARHRRKTGAGRGLAGERAARRAADPVTVRALSFHAPAPKPWPGRHSRTGRYGTRNAHP